MHVEVTLESGVHVVTLGKWYACGDLREVVCMWR